MNKQKNREIEVVKPICSIYCDEVVSKLKTPEIQKKISEVTLSRLITK